MEWPMLVRLCVCVSLIATSTACLQPQTLDGRWVGEVTYDAQSSAQRPEAVEDTLELRVDVSDGTFDCSLERCTGTTRTIITINGHLDAVEIVADADGGPDLVSLSANLGDTSITGVDRLSVGMTRESDTESSGTVNLFAGGGVAIFNGTLSLFQGSPLF